MRLFDGDVDASWILAIALVGVGIFGFMSYWGSREQADRELELRLAHERDKMSVELAAREREKDLVRAREEARRKAEEAERIAKNRPKPAAPVKDNTTAAALEAAQRSAALREQRRIDSEEAARRRQVERLDQERARYVELIVRTQRDKTAQEVVLLEQTTKRAAADQQVAQLEIALNQARIGNRNNSNVDQITRLSGDIGRLRGESEQARFKLEEAERMVTHLNGVIEGYQFEISNLEIKMVELGAPASTINKTSAKVDAPAATPAATPPADPAPASPSTAAPTPPPLTLVNPFGTSESPGATTYVLNDGKRIAAASVIISGDMVVIKDTIGRSHSIKKSDIKEVLGGK